VDIALNLLTESQAKGGANRGLELRRIAARSCLDICRCAHACMPQQHAINDYYSFATTNVSHLESVDRRTGDRRTGDRRTGAKTEINNSQTLDLGLLSDGDHILTVSKRVSVSWFLSWEMDLLSSGTGVAT
jgi:hypothetical protein